MLLDKAKSQQGDSAATAIPVSSPADSSARPAASTADSALTAADSSKKDSSADAVLVNPEIKYTQSTNEYVIQDIDIVGNGVYDKEVLSAYSGLRVGQTVKMPGEAFSNVIKKFWKQGLLPMSKFMPPRFRATRYGCNWPSLHAPASPMWW